MLYYPPLIPEAFAERNGGEPQDHSILKLLLVKKSDVMDAVRLGGKLWCQSPLQIVHRDCQLWPGNPQWENTGKGISVLNTGFQYVIEGNRILGFYSH